MFPYRLKTPPMAAQVLFFASPKPGLRIFSAFQEHTEISIAQTLLGEFDVEMANTRKVLDRAPLEKADWKPHPKSGSLGWAAGHVANLPGWVTFTLNSSKLPRDKAVESKRELMETFENKAKGARAAIENAKDSQWAGECRSTEVARRSLQCLGQRSSAASCYITCGIIAGSRCTCALIDVPLSGTVWAVRRPEVALKLSVAADH